MNLNLLFKFLCVRHITIFTLIIIVGINTAHAQNKSFGCGSDIVHREKMAADSKYAGQYQKLQTEYQTYLQQVKEKPNTAARLGYNGCSEKIIIPVVVHIIHVGEALGIDSNIPGADVNTAIAKLNSDWANSGGFGSNMNMEFRLAKRDPSGNSTTGIVRVNGSSVPNYTANGISLNAGDGGASQTAIKDLSKWAVDKYYNIWVVKEITGGAVAGFAFYPNGNPYDGTVIEYPWMDNVQHVLGHELGHGFNLAHTFEGDAGATCPADADCTVDGDGVCDTAPQRQNDCTVSMLSPCAGASNTAANWTNSLRNFMSYCFVGQYRFSAGQRARARAAATGSIRGSLLDSDGCVPVGNAVEASIVNFIFPVTNICTATFSPQISIKNYGTTAITAAVIALKIDGVAQPNTTYAGTIATNASATVTLAAGTVAVGAHVVEAEIISINTATLADGYTEDNKICSTFNYVAPIVAPVCNSFDAGVLPANWTVLGELPVQIIAQSGCAAQGANSFRFHTIDTNTGASGANTAIQLATISLNSIATPTLEFDISARRVYGSACNYWKKLDILISTNCGVSFANIYSKNDAYTGCAGSVASASPLHTVAPPATNPTTAFVPTTCAHWRHETINLSAYIGTDVIIKFMETVNQYTADDVYLDNICIKGTSTLPVELQSFTGKTNPKMNDLTWLTASEKNVNRFELQRSADGKFFDGLYSLRATNTTAQQTYNYSDIDPIIRAFYRLKMIDNDGTFEYSNTITLSRNNATANAVVIAPNPTNGTVKVTYETAAATDVIFTINNLLGQELYTLKAAAQEGANEQYIDLSELPPAVYTLSLIRGGTERIVRKIVKK